MNGKGSITLQWVLGMAGAALVAYFTSQGISNERVAVLETQGKAMAETLQRIERKQDKQDELFRGIVNDWARGLTRQGEPLPLQRSLER